MGQAVIKRRSSTKPLFANLVCRILIPKQVRLLCGPPCIWPLSCHAGMRVRQSRQCTKLVNKALKGSPLQVPLLCSNWAAFFAFPELIDLKLVKISQWGIIATKWISCHEQTWRKATQNSKFSWTQSITIRPTAAVGRSHQYKEIEPLSWSQISPLSGRPIYSPPQSTTHSTTSTMVV